MIVLPRENRPLLAIGMVLLAYFLFSLMDASVKWLSVFGFTAFQVSFMRYFAHFFIAAGVLLVKSREKLIFDTPYRGLILLRGVAIVAGTLFNFASIQYLPLSLTSTILFSAPIIVCTLSVPVLGEKVGVIRWSAIIIGFVGITIAIDPFGANYHPAAFLTLASAVCMAGYVLLTRQLAGKADIEIMQLAAGGVGFCALLPFALFYWVMPETWLEAFLLLMLGVFGWVGHQIFTAAHRYSEVGTLSPFAYSFMIYLTVWGIVLFDHVPTWQNAIGSVIVVCAGLVIWLREWQRWSNI